MSFQNIFYLDKLFLKFGFSSLFDMYHLKAGDAHIVIYNLGDALHTATRVSNIADLI